MRSILLQLSGLAGILAFLAQMWTHSPLEQSLYTGVIIGGGVYIILLLVDVVVQRILAAHVEAAREEARTRVERANDKEGQKKADSAARETAPADAGDSPEGTESSSATEDSQPALTGKSSSDDASTDEEMAAV